MQYCKCSKTIAESAKFVSEIHHIQGTCFLVQKLHCQYSQLLLDSLKIPLANLQKTERNYTNTDLLQQNITFRENKLKSKEEIIKSLLETQNALTSSLSNLNPIRHGGTFCPPPPSYQLYRNKSFLIGLTSRALFYSQITRSGQIWINFQQRVMRYDLFAEEKYNISRISDIQKNLHFVETSLHISH